MEQAQQKMRDVARDLLSKGTVDVLLGFERGTVPHRSRPCFVRTVEDVEKLVWDDSCSNNLAVYLPGLFRKQPAPRGQEPPPPPKVAIVVKGCDSLSIALLVKEHQVPSEQLTVIGMPCRGIANGSGDVMPSCIECTHPAAENADVSIPGESRAPATDSFERVREFEAKSVEERWRYFRKEMEKCIRCYACRQACPNCYCKECFADQTNPRWISLSADISDTMIYQLGRMFHQVGRCVGCDACVRACPVGIDLGLFTHKLVQDAKDLFDYGMEDVAGEAPTLLSTFTDGDGESFITDPEKQA